MALSKPLGSDEVLYFDGEGITRRDVPNPSKYRTVVLGENVKKIGPLTFSDCENLREVIMPKVESIGDFAFQRCAKLTNVFSRVVRTLGLYAFQGCENLEEVFTPQMREVGFDAFDGCCNIKRVKMHPKVKQFVEDPNRDGTELRQFDCSTLIR